MDTLSVNNLAKNFGSFCAVNNISFSLNEGEILGLLGPNSAGKTTTIQMLLGVLAPTSGQIAYFGKPFARYREEILEQVSFSSTYTNLPWELTVSENLVYLSYLYRFPEKKKRREKIIEIFRLRDLLSKQVNALSAGQLTRVNLAKAFLNFPRVLLLDEPTASLDPEAARYIRDFLLEERKQFAVSVILTSHNMAEVEEVCDRVVFINNGVIIADDTPAHLVQSIKTSHVELLIRDGLKRVSEYCGQSAIPYRTDGRRIVIDIDEHAIPEFLRTLMDRGIIYDEISIDKPTLEDYFLQVAQHERNLV
ncbi:MAG: ABC transporter ATP-binding protein [Candidatus Sungbacteria bacterium]|nr:ABC transporter ATP-binding protein [Candidatus Sungbacteria bacterium]